MRVELLCVSLSAVNCDSSAARPPTAPTAPLLAACPWRRRPWLRHCDGEPRGMCFFQVMCECGEGAFVRAAGAVQAAAACK